MSKKILIVGRATQLADALKSKGLIIRALAHSQEEPLQRAHVADELTDCAFFLLASPYNSDAHDHLTIRTERDFLDLAAQVGVRTGIVFEPGDGTRHLTAADVSLRVITSVDEHRELAVKNPTLRIMLAANMERDAAAVASAIHQSLG